MIARQVDGIDGGELIAAVRSEEASRRDRWLPDGLPGLLAFPSSQEAEWRRAFPATTRNAPIGFDDALALGRSLLDPVLDGSAQGKTWRSDELRFV